MRINIKADPLELLKKAKRADKKIAFATVNAINETAKSLAARVKIDAQKELHIRSQFTLRNVAIIKPFASVGAQRPYAEISIGQKDRLLLPELETPETEERKPFTPGAKRVAVPLIQGQPRARFPQAFPRELYFQALRLKRWPRGTRKGARPVYPGEKSGIKGQTIWRGKQRTYLIPSIGVFQRVSSNKSVPIYLFDEHVPIPKRLEFMDIMDRYGESELSEQTERAIIKEIQRGL